MSEQREIQSRRNEVIANSGMIPLNSIGQKMSISISKISNWAQDEAPLVNKTSDPEVGHVTAKTQWKR